MNIIEGGITAPEGFEAAAYEAGIKYSGRTDMAMIFSRKPCHAAGVFTSNVVKAAPVIWDKRIIENADDVHAVVVNSGIANACTGDEGIGICRKTAEAVNICIGVPVNSVLISSTGVIGMQIPAARIVNGIKALVPLLSDSEEAGTAASKAIMTTDTVNKEIAIEFAAGGRLCHMGAMAKGSGMIHPNMCTMLCFITTDISITHDMMQKALSNVVVDTFNMVSIDGDMSTNDSLMVLSNGAAGNAVINSEGEDYDNFVEALNYVCRHMAKALAGDGEGATALMEAHIINASSKADARALAQSVIGSNLVKTALCGHDANIGRILCALGYAGVDFDPGKVDLFIESSEGRMEMYTNGAVMEIDEEKATKILSEPEVTITVDMNAGKEEATGWGCDLTYDYIKINADYRS